MKRLFKRGESLIMGPPEDRWFLYTLDRPLQLPGPDQTLEVVKTTAVCRDRINVARMQIMMHDLDPGAMEIFCKVG